MIDLKSTEGIFFVGIGGIGMSALAVYFVKGGFSVAGYDRNETELCRSLIQKGCKISYEDKVETIPPLFRNPALKDQVLVIYTPAIPPDNEIISFFRNNGYKIYKRSEILGEISSHTNTIAIAGTHGKTTVSTMTAHLLKQSHIDCSAFLGGISKNYDTNLLLGESKYTVMEADEFDRSFLRLDPVMAVVTSLDADHLDIYGDQETMIGAYNEFCRKVRPGGKLFVSYRIRDRIIVPEGVSGYTYGSEKGADFRYEGIKRYSDYYCFNLETRDGIFKELRFPFPGLINIENLTAAISVALNCGVTEQEIRKAILIFQGVRRRFDIRFDRPGLTYIDDYAHHPEEIRACIKSVREYFSGRKITGIFQPHLYSRTRDHAGGFAEILDELDETILLPVYPAREKPIPGVDSELILERMRSSNKQLMKMEDVLQYLDKENIDVLLTIGAGDIDKLVIPIEQKLKNRSR